LLDEPVERPDALTAANARIADQREAIKEHCIAAQELAAARDAANARAEAAERVMREDCAAHEARCHRAEADAAQLKSAVGGNVRRSESGA
jgi:hypothetical protein